MNYEAMCSNLQSRLAKRASEITLNIYWAEGYKQLGRRKDFKETKKHLVKLHRDQKLDRDLLKIVQGIASEDREVRDWVAALASTNLIDCYVTEVLGKPVYVYGRWWVRVRYDCEGVIGTTDVMLSSEEAALKVGVGYHFLA
jgi:hypothetical protein